MMSNSITDLCVKISSGKGLVSDGIKPLFEPMASCKLDTVKCRYNAVLGVQEIDRVIAVTAL